MTITGRPKFFKPNKTLAKDGATATATSNTGLASLMIDADKDTQWISTGSDDTTVETLEITFGASATIDRLFLIGINLKDFSVEYWTGAVWAAFTNSIGLDGAVGAVTTTTFADSTSYWEFDSVTTTKIQILANKTQVVDAEKYISSVIVTEELGTFEGWPEVVNKSFSKNAMIVKVLNNKAKVFKGFETFALGFKFSVHPYQVDIDIVETLFNRQDPFLVWLCGGWRGVTRFRFDINGYRLEDIFLMQAIGNSNPKYHRNIFVNAVDDDLSLIESV